MTPPQSQYRYPRRHTPRPEPMTLEDLSDEQLEVYELPAQRRQVLGVARALSDAFHAHIGLEHYVAKLVDETDRLIALDAEHTRRLDARLSRIVQR